MDFGETWMRVAAWILILFALSGWAVAIKQAWPEIKDWWYGRKSVIHMKDEWPPWPNLGD